MTRHADPRLADIQKQVSGNLAAFGINDPENGVSWSIVQDIRQHIEELATERDQYKTAWIRVLKQMKPLGGDAA